MRELPTFKRLRYLALKNLGDIQMKAHRYAEALVNFAQVRVFCNFTIYLKSDRVFPLCRRLLT